MSICFPKIQKSCIHEGGNPYHSLNAWVIKCFMGLTQRLCWCQVLCRVAGELKHTLPTQGKWVHTNCTGDVRPPGSELTWLPPIVAFCTSLCLASIETFSAVGRGYTIISVWQRSFCTVPLHYLNGAESLELVFCTMGEFHPRRSLIVLLHTNASARSKSFPLYRETEI